MKLAVVGSRKCFGLRDETIIYQKIAEAVSEHNITEIVTGGASGADYYAERFAKENKIKCTIFNPDFEKYPITLYGFAAYHKRNQQIVNNSDMVLAFMKGKSVGTMITINLAGKIGKDVIRINMIEEQRGFKK